MKWKHLSYACGVGGRPLIAKTVGELLRDTARKHPHAEACVFSHQKVRVTYAELLHKSEEVAQGLMSLGLQKGARVGIFAANCYEWMLVKYATALSGMILVNLNPAYRRNELHFALNNVGCEALIMNPGFRGVDYVKMMSDVCPEIPDSKLGELQSKTIPSLKWAIRTDDVVTPGFMNFKDLYGHKVNNFMEVSHSVYFEDPYNIQFTSGTTGSPKGAVLTHHNLVNNAVYISHLLKYTDKERVCLPLPLYHTLGMVTGALCTTYAGGAQIYPDYGFNPPVVMDVVEKEKCSVMVGVPTMFQALVNELMKKPRDISSMKKGVLGGSSSPPELIRRIVDELGINTLVTGYGMTETSPVITTTQPGDPFDRIALTVGHPLPHTEVKIVNDKNETVPVGQVGEVCGRGYMVMKGYWNNEKATAEAIDSNRWMHTGDLGVFDSDMNVKIVGRKKDMISRGGEKIFPAEMEAFYMTHPDINEIHIIGVPDDYFGELVCAWIKMKPEKAPLTAEDLKKFSDGKVASYKIPSLVRVVDAFPLTVTGKVMKYAMREEESKRRN